MVTDSAILYFIEVKVDTYGGISIAVILESYVFKHCFMSFTHGFGFGTELSWTGCELEVSYSYVVSNDDGRVVIVSQLFSYAEFTGGFLLRVGIWCEIDIRAYLISIGSVS